MSFSAAFSSTDGNGIQTWNVTSSENGAGTNPMRILPPSSPSTSYQHSFLYALPVEIGQGTTFGDPMVEILSNNAQNQYNLTIVQPGFAINPWYADNPNDSTTHQETFMLELVTWMAGNFAVSGRENNYLIGFSKSGLGGQGLIFRNPTVFAACASYDFPAMMTDYDGTDPTRGTQVLGGSTAVYGTSANFTTNYQLSSAHLTTWKNASNFGTVNRLWMGPGNSFSLDVPAYDTLLTSLGILHTYNTSFSGDSHAWHANWVDAGLAAIIPPIIPSVPTLLTASFP